MKFVQLWIWSTIMMTFENFENENLIEKSKSVWIFNLKKLTKNKNKQIITSLSIIVHQWTVIEYSENKFVSKSLHFRNPKTIWKKDLYVTL